MNKEQSLVEWKAANVGGTHAPLELRQRVVAEYIRTGSTAACVEMAGRTAETIREWRRAPWWATLYDAAFEATRDEVAAKQRAIVCKAQDGLLDRLDNGDYQVIGGAVRRVPVAAKTLASITVTTIRAQAQSAYPTSALPSGLTLDQLADSLRAITDRARAQEAIEAEVDKRRTVDAETVTYRNWMNFTTEVHRSGFHAGDSRSSRSKPALAKPKITCICWLYVFSDACVTRFHSWRCGMARSPRF